MGILKLLKSRFGVGVFLVWRIRNSQMLGNTPGEFRIQRHTSNLLNLVWFSDLKFLNVNATMILGTSNPPHEHCSAVRHAITAFSDAFRPCSYRDISLTGRTSLFWPPATPRSMAAPP